MDETPEKDQPTPDDASVAPVSAAENSPAQETESQKIEVKTSSVSTPKPAPAEPTPAPAPADEDEPPTDPAPQSVATSDNPPPPPVPIVSKGGGKKKWLKALLALIVIGAIAGGAWYFYTKHKDDSKAAPAAQSKDVPLLKIGMYSPDYGDLYPNMSPSSYSTLANAQMFEGLVRYEGKSKIVPCLATTWSNPDSKTWLFTIAPNIKFHDGHTLSPKDVKYSLETVIASGSDLADLFAGTIASVTVVGDNQVKITTKEPDPVLLNRLAFLYIIDANLPKGAEPSQAGTGPYQIKPGTKPTGKRMQMVAFNDYHGGTPKTKALDFGGKDSTEELVKAFKNHEFNIAGPIPVADAKNSSNAYQFTSSEPNVDYIGFNLVKPSPLQNKLVREAIRYAVNAQEAGNASGSKTTPISQLIPPSIAGYNPSITPYKQNIAKAKQLLAEAGYPNGLTLRFSTSETSGTTEELIKNLKEAGITLTVDTHTDFDEFIDYFSSGKADMYTVNYASDTLDGLDILSTTFTSPNYNNPKLNELMTQIGGTTDPAKRLKLLQEAEALVDEDVAVVPLYSEDDVWLMDKNYAIQQDIPSSLISVYFYKVQLK